MGKISRTSIIILDDFNNILIAERGKGKNSAKVWGLFGKELKGKEDGEKCILKAVDKDLKCNIFELKEFKEYSIGEDLLQTYTGTVKEYLTAHKTINKINWVGKNDIENYDINEEDKMIIKDFFGI